MFKFATANWTGPGRTGAGSITSESNLLAEIPFNFDSRFLDDLQGTNPEELLAAAHASCFAMKLSFILDEAGHNEKLLRVTAKIEFVNGAIAASHLEIWARVRGVEGDAFDEMVREAERCSPVSRALSVPIICTTTLER